MVAAIISFVPYPLILTNSPQTVTIRNNSPKHPNQGSEISWRVSDRRVAFRFRPNAACRGQHSLHSPLDAEKIPKNWSSGVIDMLFLRNIEGRVRTGLPVMIKK